MYLSSLQIQHFRNLQANKLALNPRFNVFYGENGSGKTSIVEAIYFLAHGRSFRSSLLNRIIAEGQPEFTVFCELQTEGEIHRLGVSRARDGNSKIRLDGKNLASNAEIARRMPMLLFHPESFDLLTGGTKGRRQLLDWGVFHQESAFFKLWQDARRLIQQRNASLKTHYSRQVLATWDSQLVPIAEQMDQYRAAYVEQLKPVLNSLVGDFLTQFKVNLQYHRGWPKDQSLAEALAHSQDNEHKSGHTHYGPHRADLRLKIGHAAAEEVLSRGQQKLLICALKIAQGILLQQTQGRNCIYILDDMASELDEHNRARLLNHLKNLASQVFLTSIERDSLVKYLPEANTQTFWVNQGELKSLGTELT